MTILTGEVKIKKSAVVSDTNANGGRMSDVEAVSGVKNAMFPDVSNSERLAGVARKRKFYIHIENPDNLTLSTPRVFISQPSTGEDRILLFEGYFDESEADIELPAYTLGAGALKADAEAGATSFTVVQEDADDELFRSDGSMLALSDGGNTEFFSDYLASQTGGDVDITLQNGDQLANGYSAASTVVSGVLELEDILCVMENWTETSASGQYDEGAYPVEMDNIGTVDESWTLAFTSATDFTVSGVYTGSLAAGAISADYAPTNPGSGRPYFTLRSAGWSGTWASGDTISFTTRPAAGVIWLQQIVPAGAASVASDQFKIALHGESA